MVVVKRKLVEARRARQTEEAQSHEVLEADDLVPEIMAEIGSVERALRDPTVPLERRRHALATVLKGSEGQRPIVAEFDFGEGPRLAEGRKRKW